MTSTIGDMEGSEAMETSPPKTTISFGNLQISIPPEEAPAPERPKSDTFYKTWDKFARKSPAQKRSKVPSLDTDIENHPSHHPRQNTGGLISSESAVTSFEEAAAACRSKVDAIAKESRRLNLKYTDTTFRVGSASALRVLSSDEQPESLNENGVFKGCVKRLEDIFEDPKFIIDGATANDIRQGANGDCWFVAAVTALSGTEEPGQPLQLLQRLCIARDEKAGVYGFVFHRDGEWISEVVDDRLCLNYSEEALKQQFSKRMRTLFMKGTKGSDALYFAHCKNSNETWLPLLEKAYAKAHGDYQAIEGGWAGEGIEDLTGGVNVSIITEDVLDKDALWQELKRVNKDFLFGCGSRADDPADEAINMNDEEGFVRGHAYTVLEAREAGGERLLKLRNPWGEQEWNSPYSDGSKEWTAELMKELNHTFGNDGIFWIPLKNFLQYYPHMDRTRLFGPEWTVTQQWISMEVPFNADYNPTHFQIEVRESGPLVIVLAKPDDRYFRGLEGRYRYSLHFRLYREGEDTYLLRSMSYSSAGNARSCSAAIDAEAGKYIVMVKIVVSRYDERDTTAEVIRESARYNSDKLMAVGKQFDLVHSKGLLREMENEIAMRRKTEARAEAREKNVADLKAKRVEAREEKKKLRLRHERIKREEKRLKEEKKRVKEATKAAAKAPFKEEDVLIQDSKETTERAEEPQSGDIGGAADVLGESEAPSKDEEVPITTAMAEESHIAKAPTVLPSPTDETGTEPASNAPLDNAMTTNSPFKDTAKDSNNDEAFVDSDSSADEQGIPIDDSDFSWDSDIDGLVDAEADEQEEEEEDDDPFASDPWNAVCVVGLRVYSKGGGVKIGVIRGE